MSRSIVKLGIYIWVALLSCLLNIGIEGRAHATATPHIKPYGTQRTIQTTDHEVQCSEYTSVLESPTDNILEAKRASNRFATPTATIMLQGARRTASIIDALQRIVRTQSVAQGEQSNYILCQSNTVLQTISSKRFLTGYYIYHRCQMRC